MQVFVALDTYSKKQAAGNKQDLSSSMKNLEISCEQEFELRCVKIFTEAKKEKSEDELKNFILEYREIASELALFGRFSYATAIHKQLIASKCVEENDEEATKHLLLIKGEVKRDSAYIAMDMTRWTCEPDRTASLYTHALVTLQGNQPWNVSRAAQHFKTAAERGYEPARQAFEYLNAQYPNKISAHLEQSVPSAIAFEIASQAGFASGFNAENAFYKVTTSSSF